MKKPLHRRTIRRSTSNDAGFVSLLGNLTLRRGPKKLLGTHASFGQPKAILAIAAVAVAGGVFINSGFALNNNTSLWLGTTDKPDETATWDNSSMELGVKFRSDKPGVVTGISFYKAPSNTGVHTGTLWSAAGERLASATFANESASGWQTVRFAAPVHIQADTVYVASYHANAGNYSVSANYFTNHSRDRAPLHALASTDEARNGVTAYRFGFPKDSFADSNYWVDVIFQAAPAPSTTVK